MRLEKKNKKEKEDKSELSLTHEYGTVKPRARAQAAVLLEHHQTQWGSFKLQRQTKLQQLWQPLIDVVQLHLSTTDNVWFCRVEIILIWRKFKKTTVETCLLQKLVWDNIYEVVMSLLKILMKS